MIEELSVHALIEERELYPILRDKLDNGEELYQECTQEHEEAKAVLTRLEKLSFVSALPETAEALADGRIGAGHARLAAQAVRDLPPEAAERLDRLVVEAGGRVDAARRRTAVDEYAHRTAPGSRVERERHAWESRRLSVSRTAEGGVAVDGRLDVLGGETVVGSASRPIRLG